MDYSTLISKFNSNKSLYDGVMADIPTKSSYLNLITTDWETQLENNPFYQDFSNKSKSLWRPPYKNEIVCYEESKISNFNVIVIGYCKFVKAYKNKPFKHGIFVSNCDPLNKIARAMTSDLDPSINLSNEFKFIFSECGRLSCNLCTVGVETFAKQGYTINRLNQPCIADTKIFDGNRVVNRFSCQMQKMFSQSFLAVMFLKIDSRYNYIVSDQTEHRISGKVLHIIGFNESKLTLDKKIDFGHLVKLAQPEKLQEETEFLTELMSDDSQQPVTKQSNDENITPHEKLQKQTDFPTGLMLDKQSGTKRFNDDTIEGESQKKILKTNPKQDELDFLNELMNDDSFENAQNFGISDDLGTSDDDKTQELILI